MTQMMRQLLKLFVKYDSNLANPRLRLTTDFFFLVLQVRNGSEPLCLCEPLLIYSYHFFCFSFEINEAISVCDSSLEHSMW